MQRKTLSYSYVSNGILAFLIAPLLLTANPWGKDADLALGIPQKAPPPCSPSLLSQAGDMLIRFHQEVISPADGPRSHFLPSSSQYTRDAMAKYGFMWGVVLGCDRLMRENNEKWVYRTTLDGYGCEIKLNPVP